MESIEHDSPVPLGSLHPLPSSPSPLDQGTVRIKEESPDDNGGESFYFLKRITDGIPTFHVLRRVGHGKLLPGYEVQVRSPSENLLTECGEDLFVYRKTHGSIVNLQSIASVKYNLDKPIHEVRNGFSRKTCGFLGTRDRNGRLVVLMLSISGLWFEPHGEDDRGLLLYHKKWVRRVKAVAKALGISMGSPFDNCGRHVTAEVAGNWRSGHIEKKLATLIVYCYLSRFGLSSKDISKASLQQLKRRLQDEGEAPAFEIHLSRGPCGHKKRLGQCVPFVRKLGRQTGIKFSICPWERNVIYDGMKKPSPSKAKSKKEIAAMLGETDSNDADDCDSELGEMVAELDLDQYDDDDDDDEEIVREGLDGSDNGDSDQVDASNNTSAARAESEIPSDLAKLKISDDSLKRFSNRIKDFQPPANIEKPLPATPVYEDPTSSSAFGTDPGRARSVDSVHLPIPNSFPRRNGSRQADIKRRRLRKEAVRRRQASVRGDVSYPQSTGKSSLPNH